MLFRSRVEFQLRRKVLKEMNLDQVKDIFKNEDKLWSYLTGEWLTLRAKSKSNVSRCKEKRKWAIIKSAGKLKPVSPLVREKVKQGDVKRLYNQAVGLIYTIAAVSNFDTIDGPLEMLKIISNIKLKREGTDFQRKVNKRRSKFITLKI